jgi:hypothetical protein
MRAPRVYACFDASGSKNPAVTDLKYYFLLRAWGRRSPLAHTFVDVHGTSPAFAPKRADVRKELAARLSNSDVLLLILSRRTPASRGWLQWEIDHAVRHCALPVVCAYAGHAEVDGRHGYRPWWPDALKRIDMEQLARAHHVPFRPHSLVSAFVAASSGKVSEPRSR